MSNYELLENSLHSLCFPTIVLAQGFYFPVRESSPQGSIDGENIISGTLPIEKLSTPTSPDNQSDGVLYLSDTEWKPAPLIGLRFVGSCDPTGSTPTCPSEFSDTFLDSFNRPAFAESGDYLISEATKPDGSLNKRDWLIYNGQKWERINNTGIVLSIFGREGDVESQDGDLLITDVLTGSSFFDFSNVESLNLEDLTPSEISERMTELEGKVLKLSGGIWSLQDELTGYSGGGIGASDVSALQVTDAKITSGSNKIAANKVEGLGSGGKLSINGGELVNFSLGAIGAGATGTIVLKDDPDAQSPSDQEINLNDLYTNIEELLGLTFIDEIPIAPADANKYFSDSGTWQSLTLENVAEGSANKFQSPTNFWGTKIGAISVPANNTIDHNTSIKDAILKLNNIAGSPPPSERYLNTPDLTGRTFDPITYFGNASSSGFLHFNSDTSNNLANFGWSMKAAAGVKYKADVAAAALPQTDNTPGDFYIITDTTVNYTAGDWAIWNGTAYERINNSGKFFNF